MYCKHAPAVGVLIGGAAFAQSLVHVTVDMDPHEPGIQHRVVIGPTDRAVRGVAVYIFAVEGAPAIRSLGYIGGIDRGLSFGHVPHGSNRGSVASVTAFEGTPIVPGAAIELLSSDVCCMQRWFEGPEVQYLEFGGEGAGVIPPWPSLAVFTVDVELAGPLVNDEYNFYLLDAVAANFGGGMGTAGMFSTSNAGLIDTGGDAVADMTPTIQGLDPDAPVPVPPGSFVVDLIDGPLPEPPHTRGGATIRVGCRADINFDGIINTQDFFDFLTDWFGERTRGDFNRDDLFNSQDYFDFLAAFFTGCA